MVGEARVVHVVVQLPIEAGHVARDPGDVLQAALWGGVRAVTRVLGDPDLPAPRKTHLDIV